MGPYLPLAAAMFAHGCWALRASGWMLSEKIIHTNCIVTHLSYFLITIRPLLQALLGAQQFSPLIIDNSINNRTTTP
jgi:hypothetical protein